MKETRNLVIRTDANSHIGTGHLMRCLALAQGWQDAGGETTFVMATECPALEARLKEERVNILHLNTTPGSTDDAHQTAEIAHKLGANWVVIDGYHLGAQYQQIVNRAGLQVLFIDDNAHAEHYYADLVLNQNIHAHQDMYCHREPYTKLLLGTRYVLLRREFLKWQGWKRKIPEVARKVLVTLGGSDPHNVTEKVIKASQNLNIKGLEATVAAGGSNPHYEELQSIVKTSQIPITLKKNVKDMATLMAWADVAVSGGGSTCGELVFMGLPSLVVILAENQEPITSKLETVGASLNLGWHHKLSPVYISRQLEQLLLSPNLRQNMCQCAQKIVDGEGVARLSMVLKKQILRLRPVKEQDCELLFKWVNDPEVRKSAFSSDPISWEEHFGWFWKKIYNLNCYFYIALNDQDIPIGQVRFDVNNKEAEINISIEKKWRGYGYGSIVISLAVEELFKTTQLNTVHAYIKPENKASIRSFEKAKFKRVGVEIVKGTPAIYYKRMRNSNF